MGKNMTPQEIEKKSFEIIEPYLQGYSFSLYCKPVMKRVIHTSADFDYIKKLKISDADVMAGLQAIKKGKHLVTDTMMALSGINKKELAKYGGQVHCFMSDPAVVKEAEQKNTTRASISMQKAAAMDQIGVYVIGNAPTALLTLTEYIKEGRVHPALVIAVPVGFVNVVESKEALEKLAVPSIIMRGNKGGSNIAAAIVNALLYMLRDGVEG